MEYELFDKYFEIRTEIDVLVESLFNIHKKQVNCKIGCSSCCMNFSILPIEFYAIKGKINNKLKDINVTEKDETSCLFLAEEKCLIYEFRPIICRTHGTPILYMSDDENFELSVCDLNFTDFDIDQFNDKNTLMLDAYNSKLFSLNQEFLKISENKHSAFELVSLNKLLNL